MSRCARVLVFTAFTGSLMACAHAEPRAADPEARQLDPPVVIIDDPAPEDDETLTAAESESAPAPSVLAKDPNTEVITFAGEDAPPAMADEVTGTPKRDPMPSMMSDVLHGPNK